MTWYEDLSQCDYFGLVDESRLFAVGWLERGGSFPTGKLEELYVARLVELAANPWQPVRFLGYHDCDLCAVSEGPTNFERDGHQVSIGASNLFLPAPKVGVLVAPTLVLHYIHEHEYRPPDEFLEAVRDCPPMGSESYLDAIRRAGGDGVMLMKRTH